MRYLVILTGVLLLAAGCDTSRPQEEKKEAAIHKPAGPPASRLDEAGTDKISDLLRAYYGLKNALVKTDPSQADRYAGELKSRTDSLNAFLSADPGMLTLLQPSLDTIRSEADNILTVKDETCEVKRTHFEKISDNMYALLKLVELKNGGVYRQYCPMAFNDKGAYWLSEESEIRNPYFGKKMLECGEVTDSL